MLAVARPDRERLHRLRSRCQPASPPLGSETPVASSVASPMTNKDPLCQALLAMMSSRATGSVSVAPRSTS